MVSKSLYATMRDWGIKKAVDLIVSPKRCSNCGMPLRVASTFIWRGNGTVALAFIGRYIRVVMQQTGMNDRLFAQIEEQLGISIEHILFEAQRNISNALFDAYVTVLPGLRHLKRITLLRRFVVEGFSKVGLVSGMGYADILEYKPREYGLVRVKNPYNTTMVAANAAGAMEWLDDCPFQTVITEEDDGTYLMESFATTGKPPVSKRLEVDKPVTLPSFINGERCPLCHVPRNVSSRLKWLDDEGEIIDILSNTRIVMMDALLLRIVLRELEKELGDEVSRMLVTAQRDWTMEHVDMLGLAPGESWLKGRELEEAIKTYLDDLPIFGYGIARSFAMKDRKVDVVVENPFEEEVIAGTLQGLYQVFSGLECEVNWTTTRMATVSYSLEPS